MDFRTHFIYLPAPLPRHLYHSLQSRGTNMHPTNKRQPCLSYRGCRLAIQEFSQCYPSITPPRTPHVLTHLAYNPRLFIKCPLMIEREGCVLTLDYKYPIPRHFLHLNIENVDTYVFTLARRCVGVPGDFDGGEIVWGNLAIRE